MKITIFGLAGSGTSTVGKLLAKELGYTFMSTGNIYRSFAQDAGMTLYEFEKTIGKDDTSFDIKLDNSTREYGEGNDNFIFESRLAWNFIPDSYKIYLKCSEHVRYERIQQREGGDLDDIQQKNRLREKELVERYNSIYPDITFPPNESSFDIIIDAEKLLPDEIVQSIISQIS